MKRRSRRKLIHSATVLSVLIVAGVSGRLLYVNRPGYGLPYLPQFRPNTVDRWTALGGIWEVSDGSMRNESNDRGAKLLTGSPHWKDYVVEGDLHLLGSGSVGLLARVSDAELGENSFKGYFAGVRTIDNSLVLGAYDFAYHEAARTVLPDMVRPFRWYHVRLEAVGCQITAFASAQDMDTVSTTPVNDPDCFRSGSVGLRSNGTGGAWRNVRVDAVDLHSKHAANSAPRLPSPRQLPFPSLIARKGTARAPIRRREEDPPAQPIVSLRYMPEHGQPAVAVRGSVVLTRPAVYIEDLTGGVEIRPDGETPLKIGDEVEATGELNLDNFSPIIRKAQVRLLTEAVPVSPVVLTANQVAEAQYDDRFVQIEGYVQNVSVAQDGQVTIDLTAGSQSFRAILPPGRSRSHLQNVAAGSRVHVKGVSVVDRRFNKALDPFVILVRAAEDVEVVAGPPWWRPSTLILVSLVGLGLIFMAHHLYLLVKHWRLRAVAEERERLAHEIHDTLAQSFAGIGFQLQAIRNSIPSGDLALEHQVERAMSMARTSHEEARRSIASLRPQSVGNVGLLRALRECAERMVKNGTVTVEAQGDDNARDIPLHVKDTLFRIGQEAIVNSIRHAHPRTIRIRVEQQRASVSVLVQDDGDGFTADGDHAGFGLLGMRKRAETISATLAIRSAPGHGTQVEVKAAVGSPFWRMAPARNSKDDRVWQL